ncbi:MAG TPA: TonB-dependent receptor [Gammaproteobacteria bacterium]
MIAASGGAVLASALSAVPGAPASAQDAVPQQLEEITVTGSRIRRQDFEANAPIVTVDESLFQNTSTVGVETIMNQLPQFVPAVTQFTTTDVQQTANNTIGGSFISLRGLGPNRNLVLIDGKRGQPTNPQMFVDTNMIPAAAIQRVEVISGGASAVYGADAVGGVVNFILKDNFEGASVQVRFGDTQHGGNQEVLLSGLIGANAGDRGNVMIGVERSTRTKQLQADRDWRIEDARNPATNGTAFGWGSDTWISNVQGAIGNLPSQQVINDLFAAGGNAQPCAFGMLDPDGPGPQPAAPSPNAPAICPQNAQGVNLGVPNGTTFGGTTRFLLNRPSGTVYTGLMDRPGAAGSWRYEGPWDEDNFGRFKGLPFRVRQPDGTIKENNFWQWASYPLERTSAFAKGHFEIADNVRLNGSALFTRTESETNLGLTADNITFWGAAIPFGNNIYAGDAEFGIPDSCIRDTSGNCIGTDLNYLPVSKGGTGRFGLDCELDGQFGCTEREAWPLPPEIVQIFDSRPLPEEDLWLNRPPDYLREYYYPRSGLNTTTTSQLSLGLEGELPSGEHHWDVSISTGYTDQITVQRGSTRLSTYRAIMRFPNFGRGAIFDPNPYTVGFAESIPTCTSGLPVIEDFRISEDCVEMLTPDLKNREELRQTVLEANITGDLAQMPAGPLSYALGATYRENEYEFAPDNLSLNGNYIDPIAGLFPNAPSSGKFDVSELYGELLIPVVSDGPTGVEHFSFELGARLSDWSMEAVDTLGSYKALIDWGFTPRYRLRGGINRAHRAPNLGELFIERTQIFGGVAAIYQDPCSQNNQTAPFSANPTVAGAQQAAQTLAMCRAQMGPVGAAAYYDARPVSAQPTGVGPFGGGNGIQNSFGNPNLHEEQADTLTLGVVMSLFDDWTLAIDYYSIEIEDMIAVESPDSTHESCYSIARNPTGDLNNPACLRIFRNPTNGTPGNIDLTYTNAGRAEVSGVDLQINWSRMLAGGLFNLNSVMNYAIKQETQDREDLPVRDWVGTLGPCALQLQCQGYEYRIFTTASFSRNAWSIQLRHQFWPDTLPGGCAKPVAAPQPGQIHDACEVALLTGGGVRENYQLFSLSASYRFGDRYTLAVGIDNLLDEKPPRTGANPYIARDGSNGVDLTTGLPASLNNLPYPLPATYTAGGLGTGMGATYDTLGRRGFISVTMDF